MMLPARGASSKQYCLGRPLIQPAGNRGRRIVDLFSLEFRNAVVRLSGMEYRSKDETDAWHFCRNCPGWPRSNFDAISFQNPSLNFDMCKQCTALNNQGECEALPPVVSESIDADHLAATDHF